MWKLTITALVDEEMPEAEAEDIRQEVVEYLDEYIGYGMSGRVLDSMVEHIPDDPTDHGA